MPQIKVLCPRCSALHKHFAMTRDGYQPPPLYAMEPREFQEFLWEVQKSFVAGKIKILPPKRNSARPLPRMTDRERELVAHAADVRETFLRFIANWNLLEVTL